MKAKELMIGDWILYGEKPRQVRYINDRVWWDKSCHNNEIGFTHYEDEWIAAHNAKPIPLTYEILKKNGWKDAEFWCEYQDGENAIQCCLPDMRGRINGIEIEHFKCEYVHQYQHLLRLCGLNELAQTISK